MSQPILTLRPSEAQAVVEGMITFYCEASRGFLPILYKFYHKDVILKKMEVHWRATASVTPFLTTEGSGKYHCSADNGLGVQHSNTVDFSFHHPSLARSLSQRPLQKCWLTFQFPLFLPWINPMSFTASPFTEPNVCLLRASTLFTPLCVGSA